MGARRRRGLSIQAVRLLAVMLEDPAAEYYGFDLGRRIDVLSGTVYPLLRRLEAAGWLESRDEDVDPAEAGRPARRLYRLTDEGRSRAYEEVQRLRSALPGPRSLEGFA